MRVIRNDPGLQPSRLRAGKGIAGTPVIGVQGFRLAYELLHDAGQGLEFPIVVAAGFEEGTYPVAEDFDDPEPGERAPAARRPPAGLVRSPPQ